MDVNEMASHEQPPPPPPPEEIQGGQESHEQQEQQLHQLQAVPVSQASEDVTTVTHPETQQIEVQEATEKPLDVDEEMPEAEEGGGGDAGDHVEQIEGEQDVDQKPANGEGFTNPWDVKSVMDFSYFCCPECDYKAKHLQVFEQHAITSHILSEKFFKDGMSKNFHMMDLNAMGLTEERIKTEPDLYDDQDYYNDDNYFDPDQEHDDDEEESDAEYKPKIKRGRPKSGSGSYSTYKKPGRKPGSRGKRRGLPSTKMETDESEYHQCTKCNRHYANFSTMTRHVNEVHGPNDGQHSCSLCDFVHKHPSKVKKHMDTKHLNKRIPCDMCDRTFSTTSTLGTHRREMHCSKNESTFKCDQCDYSSHSKRYLQSHKMVYHINDKKYPCDMCDKTFPYAKKLQQHKEIKHYGIKSAVCDTCGKGFPTKGQLNVHTKHGGCTKGNVPIKCPGCDEEFSGQVYMYHHYRNVHGGIPPTMQDKKQFICDQCPAVFFALPSLNLHVRKKHSGPVPLPYGPAVKRKLICPHCAKEFASKPNLEEHVKSKHENHTPYHCNECPKAFGTVLKLKKHIRLVHTRIKCNLCGKEIANKFVMTQHKHSAHGITPDTAFPCELCPLIFTKQVNYFKHLEKKHHLKQQVGPQGQPQLVQQQLPPGATVVAAAPQQQQHPQQQQPQILVAPVGPGQAQQTVTLTIPHTKVF